MIWALGLKKFVELRDHPSKPKKVISRATKDIVVVDRTPKYDDHFYWDGTYTEKESIKKLPIRTMIFTGGKVLATLKRRSFIARTGIPIAEGDIRELPLEVAQPLIDQDWRNRHKAGQ